MLFEIESPEIEAASSGDLTRVLNVCLRREATRRGVAPEKVETTLRINDPDEGIDARVCAPSAINSPWIPADESAWQYKSGRTDPREIEVEFFKPGVQEVVLSDGSYCLAIGVDYTPTRLRNAVRKIEECFSKIGRQPRYKLLTASHIAQWASEYPDLLHFFGHPIGALISFDDWSRQQLHQIPFHSDEGRAQAMASIAEWARARDRFVHRRIEGPPGVGKTRLALESVRPPVVAAVTYYAPQRTDVDPSLFGWLKGRQAAWVVLVVDECVPDDARALTLQAEQCDGRGRVLTIHRTTAVPYPTSVPEAVHLLQPLSTDEMGKLADSAFPRLHSEARRWVARWSGGYVSLARALAGAIQRQPQFAGASMLARDFQVHEMLSALLPEAQHRTAMKVVALLTRVGWEGQLAAEGQAVAEFMDIDWQTAQDIIAEKVAEGLVQRQGRYRYVTPHILAIWLASEVWHARGEETLELLRTLPTSGSRRAFLERLADFGDDEQASGVAQELLHDRALFPDLDSINAPARAELLGMLTLANRAAGLRVLQRILQGCSVDELRSLNGGRREVVWTLQKLAWHRDTFVGSARLLLALAEAENETIANNATGVWRQLFQTHLGGTEVPALERHKLIEETLDSDSVDRRLLAVQAIGSALDVHELRNGQAEYQRGRVVPAEWRPRTADEVRQAQLSALRLLDRALKDQDPLVVAEARRVLLASARGLVGNGYADEILDRLESLLPETYEGTREIRETVQEILIFEEPRLVEEQGTRFRALANRLEGESYGERLRRWVGKWTSADWLQTRDDSPHKPQDEIADLAAEGFDSPHLLGEQLDWLASPEAENVWFFGCALGELDAQHQWFDPLVQYAYEGNGRVLLAGYLRGRAERGEGEWREHLLDEWAANQPRMALAVYEATWRGVPNDRGAERLVGLVEQGRLEPWQLGILAWGVWIRELSIDACVRVINALAQDESDHATEQALGMIQRRVTDFPQAKDRLHDIAWELLSRPAALGSSRDIVVFQWSQVAAIYLPDDPIRVAELIVSALSQHGGIYRKTDGRLEALVAAVRLAPNAVWELVSGVLLTGGPQSLGVEMSLRGWYGGLVDPGSLIEWASDNAPKGPAVVASLCPVGDGELGDIARRLLVRFGDDETVRALLARNFRTGSFTGPPSAWLESKLRQAKSWTEDPNPRVRGWACDIVADIERDIERHRLMEEELDL